jgi:peptide/nickel transport system permease protein
MPGCSVPIRSAATSLAGSSGAGGFRSRLASASPALSVCLGLAIGMIAGFNRVADAVLMRIMDGMMAIPGILLAVALVAIVKPSITTVVVAIAIPEVPRVVRLVRSVVLSIREQPYIEAARLSGVRFPGLLIRHVLPNTIAPLIVQASFVCASAILSEAYLSFLGLGLPPTDRRPGAASSRRDATSCSLAVWVVLYPGPLPRAHRPVRST